MNKKLILPIFSGAAILFLSAATVVSSAGIYGYSGSPVDGGATPTGQCSGCHSGGASVPTMAVTSTPAFGGSGNNRTYAANTTYTITITPSGSYSRYGMNCEIINSQGTTPGASVAMFGTFGAVVTSNCKIYAAASTTPYPPCVSHTSSSTTAPFSFKWTSPASGTGYIYGNVLGANNDGQTTGDHVSGVTGITLTLSTVGINQHSNNENALSIFPNPATDNVRITYTLRERGAVSVKLFNLNGELVADLLNETQEVGIQNNDAHLPSGLAKGLYMVKLMVNGQQSTQKLMVY
jgi:hypothetical protein